MCLTQYKNKKAKKKKCDRKESLESRMKHRNRIIEQKAKQVEWICRDVGVIWIFNEGYIIYHSKFLDLLFYICGDYISLCIEHCVQHISRVRSVCVYAFPTHSSKRLRICNDKWKWRRKWKRTEQEGRKKIVEKRQRYFIGFSERFLCTQITFIRQSSNFYNNCKNPYTS